MVMSELFSPKLAIYQRKDKLEGKSKKHAKKKWKKEVEIEKKEIRKRLHKNYESFSLAD
jgi:hypothetical protein